MDFRPTQVPNTPSNIVGLLQVSTSETHNRLVLSKQITSLALTNITARSGAALSSGENVHL